MERLKVLTDVLDVVAGHFFVSRESVSETTTAADLDGWDSLSHVTLILDIERKFGIKLPVKKTTEAANVGKLVDIILEHSS